MQPAQALPREGPRASAKARQKRQPQHEPAAARAIAYLRVSTFAQEEHGKNLEGQLDEIRAYCQRMGYAALRESDVYRDIMSGARNDRAGYYKLLARVEQGDANVIVAYEVSRFGRNGTDNAWLLVKAKEYGLRLETVAGGQDFTKDPESEFMFDILSAVAKYDRNAIMYRMLRGKKTGHKRGNWVAGTPPIGYTPVGPRGAKVLRVNSDASIVREIFERYAVGESAHGIAASLRATGRRAEHGKHQSKWSAQGVTMILASPIFTGHVVFGGEVAKGTHEPIVPQALWDAVQRRRGERRTRNPGRRRTT